VPPDTVARRRAGETAQLELLLASGAEASGVSGALVPTPAGKVQVDVLEVTDADLDRLPDDPTDRLHVLSHAWAVATATTVTIQADGIKDLRVAVARPGPLVAMKLQSAMNRGAAKEGTDLLDILRLSLDATTGPRVRTELGAAGSQLREDAARHAERWFIDRADRTLRLVKRVPEGRDIEPDDLGLVGEVLLGSLANR
jgi:hypothetical protein